MPVKYMCITKLAYDTGRPSSSDIKVSTLSSRRKDKSPKYAKHGQPNLQNGNPHNTLKVVICGSRGTFVDTTNVSENKFALKYHENA